MSTKRYNELPIFCDNCPRLALAELDAAPLCDKCLMQAIDITDETHLASRIAPLKFNEPRTFAKSSPALPEDTLV